MTARGFIIAAAQSGAGKTTVSLGLMRALKNRGVKIHGLKNGPDFIDPAFHRVATGTDSFNLDSFAMPPELLDAIVARAAQDHELIIVEGAMGLFDGIQTETGRRGATADLARRFGWPVILVIDCRAVAQTAAAVALGLARFDPKVRVAGIILNNIASERHRLRIEQAMSEADLPLLGVIPRCNEVCMPERHLGLVQAQEIDALDAKIDQLAMLVERHCDVDRCLEVAEPHDALAPRTLQAMPPLGNRIAVARDAAFSFLYPHLLDSWRSAGATLSFFSPLNNEGPPQDCDACYLPGGYPELHAAQLADADEFRRALHAFASTFPVYGECGGYMALGEALIDARGVRHRMAGLLPVVTSFETRKLTLGYRTAELCADPPFWGNNSRITGHEFHYATMILQDRQDRRPFLRLFESDGCDLGLAGDCKGRVAGSFFHAIAMIEQAAAIVDQETFR